MSYSIRGSRISNREQRIHHNEMINMYEQVDYYDDMYRRENRANAPSPPSSGPPSTVGSDYSNNGGYNRPNWYYYPYKQQWRYSEKLKAGVPWEAWRDRPLKKKYRMKYGPLRQAWKAKQFEWHHKNPNVIGELLKLPGQYIRKQKLLWGAMMRQEHTHEPESYRRREAEVEELQRIRRRRKQLQQNLGNIQNVLSKKKTILPPKETFTCAQCYSL